MVGCYSWLVCPALSGGICGGPCEGLANNLEGLGCPGKPHQMVFLVGQAYRAAVGWGMQQESWDFGNILLGSYRDMSCNFTLKVIHGS